MGKKYMIYTDASADMDAKLFEEMDIRFVPMRYMVGEEERLCSRLEDEATLKRFYDAQREGKVTRTSQITPQSYLETFEPFIKEGISVLYLCLSGGLTKTYESVCLAAAELAESGAEAKVVAVDTLCATGGMGLLAECAARNREQGMTLEENAAWLEANRLNVAHWFMVDDLMHLKRGGRIPATTAVLGSALNIKPVLEIDREGKLVTIEKKRGRKMGIRAIAARYKNGRNAAMGNRVYIVHADCQDSADELEALILGENPEADIAKRMLCPVIGAHVGPGMVAAIFFGERV